MREESCPLAMWILGLFIVAVIVDMAQQLR